jgi:hypothetical protein
MSCTFKSQTPSPPNISSVVHDISTIYLLAPTVCNHAMQSSVHHALPSVVSAGHSGVGLLNCGDVVLPIRLRRMICNKSRSKLVIGVIQKRSFLPYLSDRQL